MSDCPTCATELPSGATRCASCGCDIAGATASFQPVGSDVAVVPGQEEPQGPVLVVNKGPQLGETFFIERPTLSVGRDPERDIFLNDMTVSRDHARLDLIEAEVTVSDLGSLNGTYVNGVCVDKARLNSGDVVQIGTFQMVYFGAPEQTRP